MAAFSHSLELALMNFLSFLILNCFLCRDKVHVCRHLRLFHCRCSLSSREITKKFFNPSLLILKLRKFQSGSNPPCVHVLFEWGIFRQSQNIFAAASANWGFSKKCLLFSKEKNWISLTIFLWILSYFVDSLADVRSCGIFKAVIENEEGLGGLWLRMAANEVVWIPYFCYMFLIHPVSHYQLKIYSFLRYI